MRPGSFPAPGELRLVGGSPRYQLYPTRDGKIVACGALEQKFWLAFCNTIGLPAPLMNDLADPEATKAAIAEIIARETAEHWRPKFAAADCCVTIMASLEEALHDPHFVERGLFAHQVAGASGATMPALPVPIAATLRAPPGAKPSPKLGADNDLLEPSPLVPATSRGTQRPNELDSRLRGNERQRVQAALPRASGAAARPARRPRASRRGAAARCGRADRARSRARPARAGNPTAGCD